MSKKHVNIIMKEHKGMIDTHSAINRPGVIFGYKNNIGSDICFARLNARLRECRETKKSMQYLLRRDAKETVFKYNPLFKELRELFSAYFKIRKYSTHKNNVLIIDIKEVKSLRVKI